MDKGDPWPATSNALAALTAAKRGAERIAPTGAAAPPRPTTDDGLTSRRRGAGRRAGGEAPRAPRSGPHPASRSAPPARASWLSSSPVAGSSTGDTLQGAGCRQELMIAKE